MVAEVVDGARMMGSGGRGGWDRDDGGMVGDGGSGGEGGRKRDVDVDAFGSVAEFCRECVDADDTDVAELLRTELRVELVKAGRFPPFATSSYLSMGNDSSTSFGNGTPLG